jgi:hypothetical protein
MRKDSDRVAKQALFDTGAYPLLYGPPTFIEPIDTDGRPGLTPLLRSTGLCERRDERAPTGSVPVAQLFAHRTQALEAILLNANGSSIVSESEGDLNVRGFVERFRKCARGRRRVPVAPRP